MTTGEKIRRFRKRAGLTQKELAAALGVSESFVSQYEIGKREPKRQTLEKISAALGLPNPAWLMFDPLPDEDEKEPATVEGSGPEINPLYFELSEQDRATVDALIDHLSRAERSAD